MQLLLFGRRYSTTVSNSVIVYDKATSTWSSLPSLAAEKMRSEGAAALSDDGRLYVVGGQRGDYLASVEVMNLKTLKWSTLPTEMATPRRSCAAAVLNNTLIVIGGLNFRVQGCLSSVEACDLKTNVWVSLPPLSRPRASCSVAALDADRLVVLGGFEHGFLSCGEVFSLSTCTWSPFPAPMVHARAWFGMAVESSRLFVVGGRSDLGAVDSAEMFDPIESKWVALPPVPPSASSFGYCSAAARNGKLMTQSFVFDLESQQWTQLPASPERRLPESLFPPACFVVSGIN
jgi:hypothetical protein